MSFERACAVAEVQPDLPYAVTVGDTEVAVVHTHDDWFAIHNECSHGAVPLSDGDVVDCTVECYLHGSTFDLRTGRPTQLPATTPVPVYPIRIEGADVLVDVDNPIEGA